MITQEICPACEGELKGVAAEFLRCAGCGLWRRPTLEDLGCRSKIGRKIYKDFDQREERVAQARMRLWDRMLPLLAPYRQTNRLLDIGSSRGHFVAAARATGWDAEGCEPSEEDSAYAGERLGITLRCAPFGPGMYPAGAFDVITLWNVLDHLPAPTEALAEARRLLRPGGLLVLRVPNGTVHWLAHRVSARVGGKDMSVFQNYNFTAKALRRMFSRAGFGRCSLRNALPSLGDPYKQLDGGAGRMALLKRATYALSQVLYFGSGARLLSAPSILALAKKEANA